jgi:hypothetical protein
MSRYYSSVILFGHSIAFYLLYVGALFLFICFPPFGLDKVHRDFDVTRDLLIFCVLLHSAPNFL